MHYEFNLVKSLSGASSPGFMRVRAAAQIMCAYSRELHCTGVNCNPKCNLGSARLAATAKRQGGVGEGRPFRMR